MSTLKTEMDRRSRCRRRPRPTGSTHDSSEGRVVVARPIFHPSDLSSASAPAFRRALAMAKAMHRPLLIAHVMSPETLLTGDMLASSKEWPQFEAAVKRVAQRGTARLIRRARAAGVRASGLLLRGRPSAEIVRAARRRQAEMIVMGTHGRTGLAGLLLGSVATQVVSRAACPVLTVHGRGSHS